MKRFAHRLASVVVVSFVTILVLATNVVVIAAAAAAAAASTKNTQTFSKACFIPPASPTVATNGPLPWTLSPSVKNEHSSSMFVLKAKKRGGAGGTVDTSGSSSSSSKKIQVKLLKHVAGVGQAGEVVQVMPAFYNNKLRPTKSATPITDQAIQQEQLEQEALQKELLEQATALQAQLSNLEFLLLVRKAGPTGQLFGGISAKTVLQELQQQVPDPCWENEVLSKKIKVEAFLGPDNQKIRGDIIKHTGDYVMSLLLLPDLLPAIQVPIRVLDLAE